MENLYDQFADIIDDKSKETIEINLLDGNVVKLKPQVLKLSSIKGINNYGDHIEILFKNISGVNY